MSTTIRIATRESALARWQANWVAALLNQRGYSVEMVYLTTHGDIHQTGPVETIGTEGVFTKEIQRAVLENRADIAVHSLKDLPTLPTPSLTLSAVPARAPVADCLVSAFYRNLEDIPADAVIGTGSLRRKAQLLAINSSWNIVPIRGNLQTRLGKLRTEESQKGAPFDGSFDAIILAEAGLRRMEYDSRISQIIPLNLIMPAIGQGALGLESRQGDTITQNALSKINDSNVYASVTAERALLSALQGGCLAPVACVSHLLDNSVLELTGRVIAVDGSAVLENTQRSALESADELGKNVANNLIAQGAADLIAQARG